MSKSCQKIPSHSEDIKNMQTEFPRNGIHTYQDFKVQIIWWINFEALLKIDTAPRKFSTLK